VLLCRRERTHRLSAAGAPQGIAVAQPDHLRGRPTGQFGMLEVCARKRVRYKRRRGVYVYQKQQTSHARILVAKRFQFTVQHLHDSRAFR